jgi:transcriptional regulator GlxA family with amidase domain
MDYRVRKIIILLSVDLRRDISLTEAAEHVNLSVSRCRHLFKVETGMPLARYLKFLKLQRAKELIETTPLTIKEVMARVGIKDKSDFAKDFKGMYSLSPTQYRRVHQEAVLAENTSTEASINIFTNK